MVDTLNQTLVTQFTDMVNHKAQQTESFFKGRVLQKPVKGKKFDWQNLEGTDDNEITSRYQKVAAGSPQHERRGALIRSYEKTWIIDRNDDLQSLIDLESGYAGALAKTMARRFDATVANAALGTVLTGENLTTETTASTDGITTVTAGSGLTYDKLREVLAAFHAKGVGLTADSKLFLAITEKEHDNLLNEIEVISSDYRGKEFSVDSGRVNNILGMNVIVFPSDPSNGSSIINAQSATVNNCFAFSMDGICVGINSDIEIRVEPRYDLVDAKQVKAIYRLGALRTEAAKVVQIDVTNS
jgi:hypothetical protein